MGRCGQSSTTNTNEGEAVRVCRMNGVELSRSKGQPAATRSTIDCDDGAGAAGDYEPLHTQKNYNPPSNTALTSSTVLRSAKNGQRSVSSVSWGSLNQEDTGTALLGWKM